jgi:hypothetical protein
MPWREDVQEYLQKPLVLWITVDDGTAKVHPPIGRVFKELCEKLGTAGHELVPWDTSLNADCIKIMVRATPPGGHTSIYVLIFYRMSIT